MELLWEDVEELAGKTIDRVRYTSLGSVLGESFVVVVCTDGTVARLRCGDMGCDIVEVIQGPARDSD